MKILMTGFTPRGVGSTKTLYSYMSNTSVIIKMLKLAGHEIEQRIVEVGEPDLANKYDLALIGVAVPQSLSSRYVFSALWTAESFGVERSRFYVDDWLLHQFQSQLESGLRNPEKRFFSLDNRYGYQEALKRTDIWIKWFKFLSRSKYKLLIPAFPWAKLRVLLPKLPNIEPVPFDPTPLALTDPEVFWGDPAPFGNLTPLAMADRRKAWVLAAMRDVKAWFEAQRFDWPIEKYGNKRQGEDILTEKDLVSNVYTKAVGIIGAPYGVVAAGGGWRARYVHSAMTRSILFLDPQEGQTAGAPYNLFRTVVEKASDDQLTEIAERQREHLLTKTWTLGQLGEQLDTFVRTHAGVQ